MSFLEKLHKGMNSAPDGDIIADGPDAAGPAPDIEAPQEDAAVFAAYKSPAKKSGIPAFEEPGSAKNPPIRRQPKKIITAANMEEITGAFQENPSKNKARQNEPAVKKNTKKPMANKKNANLAATGWLSNEAQLAVNVYQTENDLVLQSAVAGIKVEDLDVLIEDDVITIKGNRPNPMPEKGDYFIEECYWGPFSRKVILPVEVDSGRADAAMRDGVLTIRIPKIVREKKKKVAVIRG